MASSARAGRQRVLLVGNLCLDRILSVDEYPREDSDVTRVRALRFARGGNSANSSVVLSQLADWGWSTSADRTELAVTLLAPLGSRRSSSYILDNLHSFGVDTALCPCDEECEVPTSTIVLSASSGSRTILHYRDLPELRLSEVEARLDEIAVAMRDWLHVEVRPRCVELPEMVQRLVQQCSPETVISMEVEPWVASMEFLVRVCRHAHVIFFAKEFISRYEERGEELSSPEPFLRKMRAQWLQAVPVLVAAWGADGAYALCGDELVHSVAFPPAGGVVDTIGAGDTFNAAFIRRALDLRHQVVRGEGDAVRACLAFACQVAGVKVGIAGMERVGEALRRQSRL